MNYNKKKIKIDEEHYEKYELNHEFEDKTVFDTDQEIEVRIPFEGYYSLRVKCKDPQIAMVEVLKFDRYYGIMGAKGAKEEVDGTYEEDTYAIIIE